MSHLSTAAELRRKCEETGDCSEYTAFVQTENASYDAALQTDILTTVAMGGAMVLVLVGVAVAASSPRHRPLMARLLFGGMVLVPIILLGIVAAGVGLFITFSSCFMRSCSTLASSALVIAPMLSLVASVPLAMMLFKRRAEMIPALESSRKGIWLASCAVLIGLIVVVGAADVLSAVERNRNAKAALLNTSP